MENDFNNGASVMNNHFQYRYQLEDIPWETMAELGVDKEKLEEIGGLDSLLKGYKTPILIQVILSYGHAVSTVDARLELRLDSRGEVVVHVHRVLEMPDFNDGFMGHEFTKEDELNLLTSGNMGRVVDLVDAWAGEVIPSLMSMDRLTNELISLRMEFVRIPAVICGVTLDLEQIKILREGKPLFIEDMLSKKGGLFSAKVQFNTDRLWIEFLFERNLKRVRDRDIEPNLVKEVPSVFRRKYLRKWQMDKLRAGEMAYMGRLVNKDRGICVLIRVEVGLSFRLRIRIKIL